MRRRRKGSYLIAHRRKSQISGGKSGGGGFKGSEYPLSRANFVELCSRFATRKGLLARREYEHEEVEVK
jgi:hypothetical protein